ncbi:MFS transporter [Hymenobacter amundsenii]|uniref:MFS transporter n=1 Tax=Hymenobacter amundsenii TaxID=2006685 RepID=UPI001F5BC900
MCRLPGVGLNTTHDGWVMLAFGMGATVAALLTGVLDKRLARPTFVLVGALLTTLAVLPANRAGLGLLQALWLVAGAGQNWVNLTTQPIIAEQTPEEFQGRVYGRTLPGAICGGPLPTHWPASWVRALPPAPSFAVGWWPGPCWPGPGYRAIGGSGRHQW